jgi:hypothetical protein
MLDVDVVDASVVECRDDAVDVFVVFENAAKVKRLRQFEATHRHGGDGFSAMIPSSIFIPDSPS